MDPTREQIASALMSGAGQKMGPPESDNPMAEYMGHRSAQQAVPAFAMGVGSLIPWGIAGAMDDPLSANLMRLLGGSMTASAMGGFADASKSYDASKMWQNTGMPGRPVPDQQNPMLMLQKLNQMQGGDGN